MGEAATAAAENMKEKHVVMIAMPVGGHINPMLHLSFKLASHGVHITFVNSEFNRAKMKIPTHRPLTSNIRFLYVDDGLPPEHGRTTDLIELANTVDAVYARNCELLLHKLALQDPPVTCVVGNSFVSHVQETTKRLNLPFVSFWTQSAASYATLLILAKGVRPPKDVLPSDLVASSLLAPGLPANLKYEDVPAILLSQAPTHIIFRLLMNPFNHNIDTEADCILLNTFEELEEETLSFLKEQGHPVLPIGPILPGAYLSQEAGTSKEVDEVAVWVAADQHEESSCLQWLDKQEAGSVIYVSFGSMVDMLVEQVEEIAMGLKASGQHFLWVIRPGLQKAGGRANVHELTKGSADAHEVFDIFPAGQGLVVPWAPQLRVLQHRAVGGFLTHCGWNSTLEALCAGVPLLAWFAISDQALNAKLIADKLGAGMKLEREALPLEEGEVQRQNLENRALVTREEVEKKVLELMSSCRHGTLHANVAIWRAKAVKAVMEGDGSSSVNLEHFLHVILT